MAIAFKGRAMWANDGRGRAAKGDEGAGLTIADRSSAKTAQSFERDRSEPPAQRNEPISAAFRIRVDVAHATR